MSEIQNPPATAINKNFEELKKINNHGAEYWSARDLQTMLGYAHWKNFEKAIVKSQESCQASGNIVENHFAGVGKMVEIGSKSQREVSDYHLSRFACYLIAQNGDPKKSEIAAAQKYFAIQARKQELSEQLSADRERLEIRQQTAEEFKALSGAARQAGVQDRMFGVFHDAGYKGLYGGIGNKRIKTKKNVPDKENLMDRMDATELAANQFRMTQTREKLQRDGIYGEQTAIHVHEQVGKEVRAAIKRIGGTMPEDIPAAEHIKLVEQRVKSNTPKLELDEQDAKGLIGKTKAETKQG